MKLNLYLTDERFQDQDYYRLGPDLHAATYTLKLGGRIRLNGSSRWVGDKENSQQNLLPKARVANFKLEGVDLSRTVIQENGISNIGKQENTSALLFSYLIRSYSYHLRNMYEFEDSYPKQLLLCR